MSVKIEKCWKCGSDPIVEDLKTWSCDIVKRYVCPLCRHRSTSARDTKNEARLLWNRTARSMRTKMGIKTTEKSDKGNNMKTYCVFHKIDLDGMASAAIVKHFLSDIVFKPYNYHDPYPFEAGELTPDDVVFFVDVVIQPYTEMLGIFELMGGNLRIIDHHKSFLESPTGLELKEKMGKHFHCAMNRAGCELTWEYFSEEPVTRAIRLLGQYDSWRDTKEKSLPSDTDWDSVLSFQMGMRRKKFNTGEFLADYVRSPNKNRIIDKTIEEGRLLLSYQDNQNEVSMHSSFEAVIKGYKCLVLNNGMKNSQVFKSRWDAGKYDFMVAFSMGKDKRWSWSFYTDKPGLDASSLAGQFGGGGHAGAAGCMTDHLIF